MNSKKSSTFGWNHPIDPAWEHEAYDGIKGFPDDWVPEPIMREFCAARGGLFFDVEQEKVSYDEIKSRFDYMAQDLESAGTRMAIFPGYRKEYDESIFFLAGLFNTASLGKERGLERLAGKNAVAGAKLSDAHKNRDDYQDKQDLQNIARNLWANNPIANITELENSPELKAYKEKYKGAHTLRDWLSQVDPRSPEMKRGRPRK